MDKLKRGIHIDFHTMPGIYDFNRDFSAEKFAEILSDANVTIINMFAQCNLGFSYYPTKIGVPYPYMKEDMFGSLLNECHKKDIKVVAYINIGLNHEMARKHYEWCRLDAEGRVIRGDRTANFFRTMCYNTGYGDYVLRLIKEICEYDIDGLFCDCMVLEACYCNKCCEDMAKEGINFQNHNEAVEFSHKVMLDISRKIKNIVPKGKLLYLNGMGYDEVDDLDTHIEVECLPSGGWGYDYFIPRASYARNLHENVLYMTGRFQASWGDFGGFKTKASIEHDIYDAMCQGIQYSVGDHMHPAENLENDIYKIIGEIYSKTKLYEKWTDNAKYQSDVGIIINRHSYYGIHQAGAARMLSELKYSFEIVNEYMDIDKFKAVILPDTTVINNTLKEKLEKYLNNNGKILSTGSTACVPGDVNNFALNKYSDFLVSNGYDDSNASYYKTVKPIDEAEMKYSMYVQGILMTAKNEADIRAAHIKPYFSRHWDGFHGYFYTPPEKETGYTAAAVNKEKNIAHVCFNIFTAYNQYAALFHKNMVRSLLEELLPNQLIKTPGMPSTARVTLTGNDNYKLLHIKVTYPEPRGNFDIIEEHNVLPAGYKVFVRGEYKKVTLLPYETDITSDISNGYTEITLPQITGYDMFLLQ